MQRSIFNLCESVAHMPWQLPFTKSSCSTQVLAAKRGRPAYALRSNQSRQAFLFTPKSLPPDSLPSALRAAC